MDTFGMLLFLLGGLAFWVFLIIFIVRKVKKTDTKKSGLITLICLGASFLGLIIGVAAMPDSDKSSTASVPVETSTNDTVVSNSTTKPEETPKPVKPDTSTSEVKAESASAVDETASNGVDPNEWPSVAALNMSNEEMLSLYKDYDAAIYSDDYPEDDMDAIEAYEAKVGQEIADKYGITPDDAFYVYSYVSMNYDKVATGGGEVSDKPNLTYGELLSVVKNGNIAVVSAKITPNLTNQMTIDENYINVDNLIKKEGYDIFDEIQYYAFADTIEGEQIKIISFTVPKRTIELSKNEKILGTMLADYVDDLWISPALQK